MSLPRFSRGFGSADTPVAVTDVVPLPAADSRGVSPFYLVVALVVAGYLGAAFLGLVFGTKPVGARVWWRLLGIVALSLVMAPLAVALVHAIGPLDGHFLGLTGACLLLCLAVGAIAVGLQSALGVVGTGVCILLFVVLGNPASGGAYATELLPGFWRTVGPYLPTGAGVDLVRNIAYFDSHALGRPVAVMALWLALGVALTAAFARARPHGLATKEDRDRQRAEAEALAGAAAG